MRSDRTELLRREGMERYGFGPGAMKRTRVCSVCGTATTAVGETCAVCGARLPRESLYDQYLQHHPCCPYCGTVLQGKPDFCPQCGRKLRPEPENSPKGGEFRE